MVFRSGNFKLLVVAFLTVAGITFVFGRPVASESRGAVATASSAGLEPGSLQISAKDLFNAKCARCHGADGRGDTVLGHSLDAPDFTNDGWKSAHSAAEMTNVVNKGQKGMPAFGKKLTAGQISSLVAYVRSLN